MSDELCVVCGREEAHAFHSCPSNYRDHLPYSLCHPFHSARETKAEVRGKMEEAHVRSGNSKSPVGKVPASSASAVNARAGLPLWVLPMVREK